MSKARDEFDKHRAFLKFKVDDINDAFYRDTQNYIEELEQQKAELIEFIKRIKFSENSILDHVISIDLHNLLIKYKPEEE